MISIEADKSVARALGRVLETKKIESESNIHLIQLEWSPESNLPGGSSDIDRNLNRIMEMAANGERVVMFSTATDTFLANNSRWQGALGYPNVAFCNNLDLVRELSAKIEEVVNLSRPRDDLAIEMAGKDLVEDDLRILKHDSFWAGKDPDSDVSKKFQERARRVFGDLPLPELIERANAAKPEDLQPIFEGREFSGTFCDVQGTLIQDGKINQSLLIELQERAQTEPITIWTDGDLKEAAKMLRQEGISWKILSKINFGGAKVATAYDDLDQAEFDGKYHIEVEDYHQVKPMEDLRDEIPGLPRA